MRVLTIVGNRPQFIKAAPLSLALADAGIDEVSLHSGQHYDNAMSEIFYDELGMREPTHSLDLRTADRDVLERGIADVIARERPDWVIVFGDTNTTLAGARAGLKAGVRLRTWRPGCAAATCRCPRSGTGSRSTASRTSCSAPTTARARRWRPKASPERRQSSET